MEANVTRNWRSEFENFRAAVSFDEGSFHGHCSVWWIHGRIFD
jgi:hypothetical protein